MTVEEVIAYLEAELAEAQEQCMQTSGNEAVYHHIRVAVIAQLLDALTL